MLAGQLWMLDDATSNLADVRTAVSKRDFAAAREAAHLKLGNRTLIREEVYEMNTLVFMESILRQTRHAFRMIRHNPIFSGAAILSLALGIGANTAMFTVLNAVLIRSLPYPEPDALVGVVNRSVIQGQVFEDADLSPSMLLYV